MKRLIWLLPVLMALVMASCLKDDQSETIVLLGTESDVKPIESMGMDTLLRFIADPVAMHGSALEPSQGVVPPDVQGEYIFMLGSVTYTNGDQHAVPDSIAFRFGGEPIQDTTGYVFYPVGQHNCKVKCEIYGDVLERGNKYNIKSSNGFVVGKDKNFTIYFIVDYDCEEPNTGDAFALKKGYIIKGEIDEQKTISAAWVGCVNIESDIAVSVDLIDVFRVDLVKTEKWTDRVDE